MERLLFPCPVTGKQVDVGIESEIGTLLRIREAPCRAWCPHCGQQHQWRVGEAQIEKSTPIDSAV
jgi:hypothetical protein